MNPLLTRPQRLLLIAAVLALTVAHLAWEAHHGGVKVHHPMRSAAMPGLSNLWGLLLLPLLAAWAAVRMPRRWRTVLGFGLAVVFGLAISYTFGTDQQDLTGQIFLSLIALALLLPGYRAECLLGFVLGMMFTFGAVIPTVVGGTLAALSALVHRLLWPAAQRLARRLRPEPRS